MKCDRCGKPFNKTRVMHPIDPPGTKGRRWVCADCETDEEKAMVPADVRDLEDIILGVV